MPRPTLYSKGSLVPLNKKVTKDELDTYHKLQKKIKGENVVMNTILSQGPKPTIVAESINTAPVNTTEVKPTDTTNPATPAPNTETKK